MSTYLHWKDLIWYSWIHLCQLSLLLSQAPSQRRVFIWTEKGSQIHKILNELRDSKFLKIDIVALHQIKVLTKSHHETLRFSIFFIIWKNNSAFKLLWKLGLLDSEDMKHIAWPQMTSDGDQARIDKAIDQHRLCKDVLRLLCLNIHSWA